MKTQSTPIFTWGVYFFEFPFSFFESLQVLAIINNSGWHGESKKEIVKNVC
jgi:hypothetical protein